MSDYSSYKDVPCCNNLTIRPLGSNMSLHIHEGAGGTAHLKTSTGEYHNLSSYDAAMLDLRMDSAGMIKIKK